MPMPKEESSTVESTVTLTLQAVEAVYVKRALKLQRDELNSKAAQIERSLNHPSDSRYIEWCRARRREAIILSDVLMQLA